MSHFCLRVSILRRRKISDSVPTVDREPEVPVNSGRGEAESEAEKWLVGKIARKRSPMNSPECEEWENVSLGSEYWRLLKRKKWRVTAPNSSKKKIFILHLLLRSGRHVRATFKYQEKAGWKRSTRSAVLCTLSHRSNMISTKFATLLPNVHLRVQVGTRIYAYSPDWNCRGYTLIGFGGPEVVIHALKNRRLLALTSAA